MELSRLRDRRVIIAAVGGGLALVAALGIGIGAVARHAAQSSDVDQLEIAESSAPRSLQLEMGTGDNALDLRRPLRCFVGGQYVGMLTLKDCAQRNGVETGQLGVGIDATGEVAAASGAAAELQPLPETATRPAATPAPAPPPPPAQPSPLSIGPEAAAPAGDVDACWRYSGDWRKLGGNFSLDTCIQALFAGKCVRPGAADYGRWGETTLRLVPGKVERQSAGGGFRTVIRQPPGDCSIPHAEE